MKIRLINHAGAFVDSGELCLLFDPWFEGEIFNSGWSLLAPTPDSVRDFSRVTHLWFSHEHPDHFHPPTLNAIPERDRERIEVLFQETEDRRILGFCETLGFRVRELPAHEWVGLADGIDVLCGPVGNLEGDSWLCLRTPEGVLLNTNDCNPRGEAVRAIGRRLPPVDVLMTQFSGAHWTGNVEDRERRRELGRRNLETALLQCREFEPRWIVPFASFAWFSHEENFYLNEYAVSIEAAVREIEASVATRPVALYPGDTWVVDREHDNASALERWRPHYDEVRRRQRPLARRRAVDHEALMGASGSFFAKLEERSSPFLARIYLAMDSFWIRGQQGLGRLRNLLPLAALRVEPCHIWVNDLNRSYRLLPGQLRPSSRSADECDLQLSADALMGCFTTDWGGETLLINGRFQERNDWASRPRWLHLYPFFFYFRLARRIQRGYSLSWGTLWSSLARRVTGRAAA